MPLLSFCNKCELIYGVGRKVMQYVRYMIFQSSDLTDVTNCPLVMMQSFSQYFSTFQSITPCFVSLSSFLVPPPTLAVQLWHDFTTFCLMAVLPAPLISANLLRGCVFFRFLGFHCLLPPTHPKDVTHSILFSASAASPSSKV